MREHFAFLGSIVRDHDGAVVKTIGDAVMASFGDPADAVKAALAMQARIAEFNRANAADRALAIKLGVHVGGSVMVSLNDRLDYFGSTVNMAARLQGQSTGGDIVLSRAVAEDPAVKPLLEAVPTREESVSLKGFADPISSESASAVAQIPARYVEDLDVPPGSGCCSAARICRRARTAAPRRRAASFQGSMHPAMYPNQRTVRAAPSSLGLENVRRPVPGAGAEIDLVPGFAVAPAIAQEHVRPGLVGDADDGVPGDCVGEARRQEERCTHAGPCQGLADA